VEDLVFRLLMLLDLVVQAVVVVMPALHKAQVYNQINQANQVLLDLEIRVEALHRILLLMQVQEEVEQVLLDKIEVVELPALEE
jgi:hypothetical protein